jgi:L-ascorbate metabolism protein UlaG (beta-lactamase superfamily)
MGRPTAHIVTVSHDHPGHNNTAGVRPMRDPVFVVDGPGEYEVRNVLITGVRTYHDKEKGTRRGFNTIYAIYLDEVVYCHLGDLGHDLSPGQIEEIGNVDVLFVPVGGDETIEPSEAMSVISQIEPRVVIPMHYAHESSQTSFIRELTPLDKFIHEMGLKEVVPQEKVSISPSTLPSEDQETRFIVMRPTND